MSGKVALGSLCAGLCLWVAVRSDHNAMQAVATIAGSCLMGFTATTWAIEQHRERKYREAHADVYLDLLRQINRQQQFREVQKPAACIGCCHYHGQSYGGTMLVCAMHPSGVETDRCGDWESQVAKTTPFVQ